MFNALRAEFRKLYTVRSTYVITLIILIVSVALTGFWIYGYKDVGHATQNANALRETVLSAVAFGSVFAAFLAILSVGHEYRYNTVLYSLTSINHRSKVFFAKWLALLTWAAVLGVLITGLSIAAFYIGQQVHGLNTVTQNMPDISIAWRLAASMLGFMSFAFIITMLVRSLVAAIAIFLVMPTTIETLLGLILKDNTKYLPFTSLSTLTNTAPNSLGFVNSLLVTLAYVVVFGVAAYVLFVRRDAN